MNDLLKKFGVLTRGMRGGGPNPSRDWLLLLAGTMLLLVASVGWNVWYFSHIEDGTNAMMEEEGTLEAYPAGLIKEIFAARATTSAAYRSSYPFIDPSR